jgi:uncharacterized membrane protein YidH (DUF202 family)
MGAGPSGPSERPPPKDSYDPGLAGDRTALAWTRSALNMAVTGVLAARAAFVAHLPLPGIAVGIALAAVALIAYRHALRVYPSRRLPGAGSHHQARAFRLLTATALGTAAVAAAVVAALVS